MKNIWPFFTTKLLVIIAAILFINSCFAQSQPHDIVSSTGKYAFSHQATPDPISSLNASAMSNGYSFQWESSTLPLSGFTIVSSATAAQLTFSGPLTQTTFYRRLATKAGVTVTSNIVRYEVVSTQWEDLNYMRVHDVLKPGQTTWQQVDQLAIGDKLVSTTYLDGLGRTVQSVEREMATPAVGSNVWGDLIQHYEYDAYGRSPKSYLPYSSTQLSGTFRQQALSETNAYYLSKYNDVHPFTRTSVYDNSPLHRPLEQILPGDAWNSTGCAPVKVTYLLNATTDDVKRFTIGYGEDDKPVLHATAPLYAENSLAKTVSTDDQGKIIISFTDDNGKLILKKVQLSEYENQGYQGWICTYYVYDDFGRLRCEINPEGVEWLRLNNWSFSATNGSTVFAEQCFVYGYDFKGRTIYKKQPGQVFMRMIYDNRDRLVLTQDGNQRIKSPTPEWTAYLYDDLDRPTVTTLYYTSNSLALLQAAANTGAPIVSTTHLNNTAVCTPLKYLYYEGANFTGRVSFNSSIAAKAAVAPAGSNQLPITPANRMIGFATGSRTRVLGTTTWLPATIHYDDDGNVIQHVSGHVLGGNNVVSNQYAWDGRILATATRHSIAGGVMTNYDIVSRYTFDKIGRVTATEQKYGTNAWRVMVNRSFDDLGRTANKRLSPNYTGHFSGIGTPGAGLENLAYAYNIQGTLIGINKAYALKESGYNKWGNFFGLYLHYAEKWGPDATPVSQVFDHQSRFNGQLEGVAWNSQGDDIKRRYTYDYDAAGRMTKAQFAQESVTGFVNTALNFSEDGPAGILYDLNGNIKSMVRYGFQMGNSAFIQADYLQYEYNAFSNKLKKVTDLTANPGNGTAGDFKDGINGTADDYVYDANGNMIVDLNKNITNLAGVNGIRYNHLDKPEEIKIDGKGTIKITYDADGAKLKREFISATGGVTKVTWYMGIYQYEEVTGGSNPQPFALSFISFSEGRIRPITAENISNGYDAINKNALLTLPGSKKGSIDYFITDHRSDVRMILTEETQWSYTTASMETASGRDGVEANLFGTEVHYTRVAKSMVPAWESNTSQQVTWLNSAAQRKIGPNQLLKVMAGDQLSTTVKYYFANTTAPQSGSYLAAEVANIIGGLILSNPGSSAALKAGVPGIQQQLGQPSFNYWLQYNGDNGNINNPKANLSILFFDERFNFVSESSQQVRVSTPGNGAAPLVLSNIKAPKNGYCFIYISNESSESVYFDDLQVRHDRGRILEENHYYAYGLKIAALSSKAFGGAPNNYQYQGDYSEFDDDLGWNDFALRSYDPQLGRFLQHDPYDQFASGYVGMGNDPGNGTDPTGGFFGVGGSGCAAAAGMSGYGGFSASVAKLGNMGNLISTISTIGSATSKGMVLGGSITSNMGNNNQSINQSANSGNSESSGPNAGSGENEDGKDGCPDCPKGYESTPGPNTHKTPYYRNIDDVARYFAIKLARTDPKWEHSGLILQRNGTLKDKTTVPLFTLSSFEKGTSYGSPGAWELLKKYDINNKIGLWAVGHIHHHPKYTGKINESFSPADRNDEKGILGSRYIIDYFDYFVVGSGGALMKQLAKTTKQENTMESTGESELRIDKNILYNSSLPAATKIPDCPCYRIIK